MFQNLQALSMASVDSSPLPLVSGKQERSILRAKQQSAWKSEEHTTQLLAEW